MNNLHRDLAPISAAAWASIEEEAKRTLARHLAARRVVDVVGPEGLTTAAVTTGHLHSIAAPGERIEAAAREVQTFVEFRVPFELARSAIDDVERGAKDSDWAPLKEAAKTIAFAEDRAVFEGYPAGGIEGFRQATSNPLAALAADATAHPDAIAHALATLRLAGVEGPYTLVLGAEPFTALSAACEGGYPVMKHVRRLLDQDIVWAPAIAGGLLLSTRGGDFELHLGQDISIGYLEHTPSTVRLYFEESFTFLDFTSEASVHFEHAAA